MSCLHLEEYLENDHNKLALNNLLNAVIFPITEKGYGLKVSLICRYCQEGRISDTMVCASCIYSGCILNGHFDHHYKETGHAVCLSLEQGEVYCATCRDFQYHEMCEEMLNSARGIYFAGLGMLDLSWWRPSQRDIPLLKWVKTPNSGERTSEPRGLVNMGNTCFLNVVVQALAHTPALRDFLLGEEHRCPTARASRECVACELVRVAQALVKPRDRKTLQPLALTNLLYMIWSHVSDLARYDQHDAHELFLAVLSLLHTHLSAPRSTGSTGNNNNNNNNYSGNGTATGAGAGGGGASAAAGNEPHLSTGITLGNSSTSTAAAAVAVSSNSGLVTPPTPAIGTATPTATLQHTTDSRDRAPAGGNVDNHIANGSSKTGANNNAAVSSSSSRSSSTGPEDDCECIVHQAFMATLESKIVYDCGLHTSRHLEVFRDLSLEIFRREESVSLEASFRSYFGSERMRDAQCSSCRKLGATKQYSLFQLPNIFSVHLKRCHAKSKVNTKVHFPQELDLAPFISNKMSTKSLWEDKYSLYSVINHRGQNSAAGHYTVYVRTEDNAWCHCDDHNIRPVSLADVLRSDAYMLFYHKNSLVMKV